jgi:sugar/nucleoside kinase (ribokinase family)
MSVLVVGSVAYDTVETLAGIRDEALGGSATYFSISSSFFTRVSIVAVVGEDFRSEDVNVLNEHGIDLSGLERRPGKTFRWAGRYITEDVNARETLDTQLNVFADFSPTLSLEHRQLPYLFLANIDPELQLSVLDQMTARPRLVALDTMNFWIEGKNRALRSVVRAVDVLLMDEGEARSFAGEFNLVSAGKRILSFGPTTLIVKRGEHGVLLFKGDSIFATPAYPLERVVDSTGAGDAFAGGFMGYLAATGDLSDAGFRRAAVLGSVMGSFDVESFSTYRLNSLNISDIHARFRAFTELAHFEPLGEGESLT